MKKNGFTLIELLAVMVIIVLLFSFGYPAIKQALSYSKNNIKNVQINSILTAAYNYTLEHTNYLPEIGDTTYISLARLKQAGLIDINIVDPDTEQPFKDDVYVSVQNASIPSGADLSLIKKEGNYLYTFSYNDTATFSINLINSINDDNTIDVNDSYSQPSSDNISSVSYEGASLTGYNTIINVVKDGYMVSGVDTSKVGIYKITYTVEKNDKIASKTIRVTVNDETAPELTLTSSTITLSVGSTCNLNEYATCDDNLSDSNDNGNCEIIINGTVDTNKAGSYVIKYKARDSFGNTSDTKTLIIKVE